MRSNDLCFLKEGHHDEWENTGPSSHLRPAPQPGHATHHLALALRVRPPEGASYSCHPRWHDPRPPRLVRPLSPETLDCAALGGDRGLHASRTVAPRLLR